MSLGYGRLATGPATRDSLPGTALAIGQALALHVVLFALLAGGMWWTRSGQDSAGRGSVDIDLVGPSALSVAMQKTLGRMAAPVPQPPAIVEDVAPAPEPLPAPPPEEVVVQPEPAAEESLPEPAAVEQQRVEGIAGAVETGGLPDAELDSYEQEFGDRKARILALRRASRATQTLAARRGQVGPLSIGAGATTPVDPGATVMLLDVQETGDDAQDALLARYAAELQDSILRNWIIPATVPADVPCRVTVELRPGGELANVLVDETCPFDEAGRLSIVDAVVASQPLPHEGFEAVFAPALALAFQRHLP